MIMGDELERPYESLSSDQYRECGDALILPKLQLGVRERPNVVKPF